MNQFFTEVNIPDFGWRIDYQHKISMLGSCFTENIGLKLENLKFQIDQNPFGIIYNPESIATSLSRLIDNQLYTEWDLFEQNGIWGSFDHHSRFSSVDIKNTLEKINSRLSYSSQHLKNATFLLITFGTAWVYERKKTGKTVSNCHKFPASDFNRFRLGSNDIAERYQHLLTELWKFNSNLKILFTVSPIRHWKDGAIENQLSKSSLLLAVDHLVKRFGKEKCAYFPSYEIMMDELRDYRFYAPDLLHLNESAIEHIWNKFYNSVFTNETKAIVKDVMKLNKAKGHRVLNSKSESYRNFLLSGLGEIERLTKNYPFLNLRDEKIYFERELTDNQSGEKKNVD